LLDSGCGILHAVRPRSGWVGSSEALV